MKNFEFIEYFQSEYIKDKEIGRMFDLIKELSNEVYSILGQGFSEDIYQKALQIEMRNHSIRFQREVNVEIFYKNIPLGFDRPDFIIRPFKNGDINLSVPMVIELKSVKKLYDKHKSQAKTYLRSLPLSSDEELKNCRHCMLINFPESLENGVEAILIEMILKT